MWVLLDGERRGGGGLGEVMEKMEEKLDRHVDAPSWNREL
jgi:hypothetical protein